MPELPNNDRAIRSAMPKEGKVRTRWTIKGRKGLCVNVSSNNDGHVHRAYYFRDRQHNVEIKIGDVDKLSLAQAWDKGKEYYARLQLEGVTPRSATSFDDIFREWLERHAKQRKTSWRSDVSLYNLHVKPRIGGARISELDRPAIIKTLDDIAASVSGIQANRSQSLISAVFSWALDESRVASHPALRIRKRAPENKRERVLSSDELRALWGELGDAKVDRGIKLLALLGQRRTEVALAHVGELLEDGWLIPAVRTKSKRAHLVPLSAFARKLFSDGIGVHKSSLSHRFQKLALALEIEDAKLHDIRHTVKTGMIALGVTQELADRVQNHATGNGAGLRYNHHAYLAEKRDALARWENKLMEIVRS